MIMNSSMKITSIVGLAVCATLAISDSTIATSVRTVLGTDQHKAEATDVTKQATVSAPTNDAIEWADVDPDLFPLDQAQLIDWVMLGDRVEALVQLPAHERAIWLTIGRNSNEQWQVEDAAFAGEYVFLSEQLAGHEGFAAISDRFVSINEQEMFTLLEIGVTDTIESVLVADKQLREHAGEIQVERNLVVYSASVANDPGFSTSWTLQKLEMEPVWERYGFEPHGTGPRAVIAVIDSGASDKGDFRFWKNTAEIEGNGVDDDANGFIDDVDGWNFFSGSNDVSYAGSHGATVSRIAASISGNGIESASPATSAELMRILYSEAVTGSIWTAISASIYAVNNGANVVNWSFVTSGPSYFPLVVEMGEAENVIFAAAAGNNGKDLSTTAVFPAKIQAPNLLAVGASDSSDRRASSNYGKDWVHLFAPASVTSYSTPLVTSAAALLYALDPTAHYSEVVNAIINGVDQVETLADMSISGGRLNVKKAVEHFMGVDLDVAEESSPAFDAPVISKMDAFPSSVALEIAQADGVAVEVQYSRDGGEFICCNVNVEIEGSVVKVNSLLEGSTYIFRMRYVDGETASEWQETESIETPVYIDRSTLAQLPLHYWNFAHIDGAIKDFGTAGVDVVIQDGSYTDGAQSSGAIELADSVLNLPLETSGRYIDATTVAMWINIDASMEAASAVIFEAGDSWAGFNLVLDRGNVIAAAWNRLGDDVAKGFSSTVLAGEVRTASWMHVALVHKAASASDNGILSIYIDGELVASGTADVIPSRGDGLSVGRITGETRFRNRAIRRLESLNAEVDQLGVWEVALNQQQLQEIFSKTFR
jgi:hypothetical protein